MTSQTKAYIFGLSAVLLWSTVATAFKFSLQHMEPVQLQFYACVTSAVVLAGVLGFQKKLSLLKEVSFCDLRQAAVLGLLNPFLYYWVLFIAYDVLPAQEAQPLNYTWAITLSILAVPLLGQKLRRIDLLAITVSYFGILVIATHGDVLSLRFTNGVGVALALISTIIWALYWILNTKSKLDPVVGLFLSFVFAIPAVAVLCGVTEGFAVDDVKGLYGAGYVGLCEMGITFVLWLKALKLTDKAAKIANLIFLSPIISLFLISIFVGEDIHQSSIIGLLLIIAGNAVQQKNS